jgi:hypothetical protein
MLPGWVRRIHIDTPEMRSLSRLLGPSVTVADYMKKTIGIGEDGFVDQDADLHA